MSNTIFQIRRSSTTATPGSLANGELAYSGNSTSNSLFVGMPGNSNTVTRIAGGKYVWLHQSNTSAPGTLTSNAVVITDGNSFVSETRTSNLVIGATGNTQDYITSITLDPTLASASNNQLAPAWIVKKYVDDYSASAIDELTDVTISSAANNDLLVYDAASGQWENHTISGTANQITVAFNNNNIEVSISNSIVVNTSVAVGSNVSLNTSAILVGNSTAYANITYLGFNTTGDINANNLNISGNTTVNNDLLVKGNTQLGNSAINDVVTFVSRVNTAIVPNANITYDLGSSDLRWNNVYAYNVDVWNGTFHGNVSISGNLTITGNLVSVNVQTLSVTDSLIQLAGNNTSDDLVDIGMYGNYQTGGGAHEHTGLFRDATDGVWKLFKGLQVAPTDTVDTSNSTFETATLSAYLSSGALVSNATSLYITANSTVNVNITANSLTLSTPLGYTSGGLGFSSYALGDLIVGNTSGGIDKLSVAVNGKVLQSNGTTLVYDDLDGGAF